tara:strand:- start:18914 stop:20302 length:1389 start_codon:yes stop_codon:yes gene_type:complete
MNIKKIIKEEVDDFDWIREIPAHKLHYACDVINHIEEGDVVYLTGYAYYIDDAEDPNDPNHIEVRFDNDKGIVIKKFSIDGGVTYDYFDVKMDEKFFDNPEDTDEVSFHCEEHMEGWDDPNKNIKLRLGKPLKESNDFDWAKETNPIQYKDLKGYHFFYGSNPKKYTIDDVIGDDLIYIWWDAHNDEYDKNTMNCDTFIHRVKLGNYKLFDNDNKEVNPKDLAYTDGTFDDDERKEIWEQDESDDFDWIRNVSLTKYRPRIGEYIEVISIGGNEDYRNWLGDYVYAYEDGMYGKTIKGVVKDPPPNTDADLGFSLQEENTDDEIYFPFYEYIKTLSNGQYEEYKNLKLEYRPLFPLEVQIKNSSINESDEWEWARTTKPIELQDPKEWIGRQFGYGQEIIDRMDDGEINMSYDEEIFTITGIDENDNLILIKHHPVYGDNHDSSTSPRNLRDYISKGKWVWV